MKFLIFCKLFYLVQAPHACRLVNFGANGCLKFALKLSFHTFPISATSIFAENNCFFQAMPPETDIICVAVKGEQLIKKGLIHEGSFSKLIETF